MYPTYLATCKDKDDIPEEDSLYELVYGIYKNTRR